jgi:hypothetical protein
MLGSLHFSFIVESILGRFHLPHDLMCSHQPSIVVENMPHGSVSNPSQPQQLFFAAACSLSLPSPKFSGTIYVGVSKP